MTINHAILGILSIQPMTGYDLKKVFQDSIYLYWSGNNNQIYKALVELLKEELVSSEIELQQSLPAKKRYTITAKGLTALKDWTAAVPEETEYKRPFLIQLAWADLLDDDALQALLAKYEEQVTVQVLMCREKIRRGQAFEPRTVREAILWESINESVLSAYQQELDWVCSVQQKLLELKAKGRS